MKYMILTYASQQDYDAIAGKPGAQLDVQLFPGLGDRPNVRVHWMAAASSASCTASSAVCPE